MSRMRTLLLFIGVLALLAGVYGLGVATAPAVQQLTPRSAEAPDVQEQFKVFWQAWDLVDQNFVDREAIDTKKRSYGAIQGMLDSLGDIGHTRFLSPDDLKEQQESLAARFEGIGAEVSVRDGRPIIVTPLDGSPAERAGIQAGDVMVAVDGEDTGHMTLQEVIRRIRGAKGSTVRLSVIHPNQTTVTDLTITREEIKVHSVVAHYLPQSEIGHVRISQFATNANSELVDALKALQQQGAKGLVIDVRNDPGGLLEQAVAVTSQFLKQGEDVLLEQDSKGNRRAYHARPGGLATDIPIAVLINRGTASAAEIFAGAIKDNQRGVVIGERTFGTGTVLATFPLSDGSALLLATGEWLTPHGTLIKNNGVTPDSDVKLEAAPVPLTPRLETQMSEEEILKSDAQLRAAVEAAKR